MGIQRETAEEPGRDREKMERCLIGIDSGTSGIKAVLFDTKGDEIDERSRLL